MRELGIVSRTSRLAPAPLRTQSHENMITFLATEKQNARSYALAWRPNGDQGGVIQGNMCLVFTCSLVPTIFAIFKASEHAHSLVIAAAEKALG